MFGDILNMNVTTKTLIGSNISLIWLKALGLQLSDVLLFGFIHI